MSGPRFIRGWEPLPVPGTPKISMVVATYDQADELSCLLYSFKAQTYSHWEAIVVHDGPGPLAREVVEKIADPRVRLIETAERKENYGHPWREAGIAEAGGDFIGLTNGDNYYCPVYFEWVLHRLTTTPVEIVYCDMLHSHNRWELFECGPAAGRIDLGAFVATAALMKSTRWTCHEFAGDGVFFEAVRDKAKGMSRIPFPLFVHN